MQNLIELQKKIEAATGPGRELDADIYEALGFQVKRRPVFKGRKSSRSWAFLHGSRWEAMDFLTGSVDAAIALVERMLPGWFLTLDRYIVTDNPETRGCWRVWLNHLIDDESKPNAEIRKAFGRADTPALAILSALINALLARSEKTGE